MHGRAAAIAVAIHLSRAVLAHAQPWVPARGEGAVSFNYQTYDVAGHFDVHGNRNNNGGTYSQSLLAEIQFGITDRLALTVGVPFVASKYTGPPEYRVGGFLTVPGPLDDGTYHGTFQDFRIEMRRAWWIRRVAVAPLAAFVIPTHHYETHGEAVAGRDRREAQIGASAGIDLARFLPHTLVSCRYALASAERQHGFSSVRSNIDLDGEYAVTRLVSARGLGSWQVAHKGPTIPELEADDWLGHDRFIVSTYFDAGAGVSLALRRNVEVNAVWMRTVSGSRGAHAARMLSVGVTVGFGSSSDGFSIFTPSSDH
jgi:hypothetical protein